MLVSLVGKHSGDVEVAALGPFPRMCLARHLVAEALRREERSDTAQGWAGFPAGSNPGR